MSIYKDIKDQLEIIQERDRKLEIEVDDMREFVKSADKFLQPETATKARSERLNDLNNLRTMCDYLMKRYINEI